ncbi:MAG: lysostaphin resistance A-like protein [Candidatus Thorarchaeota archaeon]
MVTFRSRLLNRPMVAGIIVIAVYLSFYIIGEVASLIIANLIIVNNPLLAQTARFVILFLINVLVWFWIIPQALQLPDGRISFAKYVDTIHLDRESGKPYGKNILYAFVYVSVFCLGLLIASLLTGEYVFEIDRILGFPDNQGNLKSFGFVFNLIPGLFEEVAYRGVILVLLLRKYSEKTSIIISGIMFGVSHLINILVYGISWNTLTQVLTGILIGVFFAYIVLKSGTLLITIMIHYMYNSLSILFVVFDESDPMVYFFSKMLFASIVPILINGYLARNFLNTKTDSLSNQVD